MTGAYVGWMWVVPKTELVGGGGRVTVAGGGEFEDPGEQAAGLLVPIAEAVNALLESRAEGGVGLSGEGLDAADVVGAVGQVGLDGLA